MVFPLLDFNEFPVSPQSSTIELSVSPQSPSINSPGLDDLESYGASFFGTNNINVNADEEVDQGIINPELNPEGGSLQSETPVCKKELTSAKRQAAYQCLLERMEDGVLKRVATNVVAGMFEVGIRSMQRFWKRARESCTHDYHSQRVRNCGRKRIEIDLERIRDILLMHRTSIGGLAFAFLFSLSFLSISTP